MKKKKICIDISNIIPGKGGTGGGIATYSINLLKYLDNIITADSPTIYCLKNKEFTNLPALKNIITKNVKVNNSNLFSRLFWLNVRLPFFCISTKINVLHRILPELPSIKVCKYIVTMHDFMFDFYLQRPHLKKHLSKGNLLKFWLFKKMGTMALNISDGIIVPAKTIKDEIEKKIGLPQKKIVATYLATEFSQFGVKEKNRTGTLNIGVVAGFYPHKNHFAVLKLAKNFIDRGFVDFKISIRGAEVYKTYVEDIKKEILKNNLRDFVTFEPFVSAISLDKIYSSLDLVLLLSEYEGFGLPVLEAQAHSVPVACSNIPIFKEVLRESAFYLSLDFDKTEVSEFIKKVSNEILMKDMTSKGLENVKRFSWNSMAKDTLVLYESFLQD